MAPNRIMRGGSARRASSLLLAAALAVSGLGACGSDGNSAAPVVDKAADAAILNGVLGRELAVVSAYGRALPLLHGAALARAREFRAQEQEHVDALLRTLRGLGEEAQPEEEEIESEGLKTRADALEFLYELEAASVDDHLRAISHLTSDWPRSLLGAIAANQAQHLVVLRQALGSSVAESIPSAFEDGETAAPSEKLEE